MLFTNLYIDFQMQATVFKAKNVKPTVDKIMWRMLDFIA